eukprot:244597_1
MFHEHHSSTFKIDINDDPIHWLSAIGTTIMVIVLIYINISLTVSIRKFRQENKSNKMIIFSVLTTVSFTITSIICLLTTILAIISSDFYHETVFIDTLAKMAISFYTFSQTLMIHVFIRRIDSAFSGSLVEYPTIIIRLLYFASIIITILCLCMALALSVELFTIFIILTFIWMILFLCLSTILCILFVRKANLLLDIVSSVGNNIDQDILYVVIKQSILVPMAICTSFTSFIMTILVQIFEGVKLDPAMMFFIVVDCTVSSMSIFLLFSWSNHIYNKLCHLLHKKCEERKKRRMSHAEININKKSVPEKKPEPNVQNTEDTCVTTGHHKVSTDSLVLDLIVLPKLTNSQSEPSDLKRCFSNLTMAKNASTNSWSPETKKINK